MDLISLYPLTLAQAMQVMLTELTFEEAVLKWYPKSEKAKEIEQEQIKRIALKSLKSL